MTSEPKLLSIGGLPIQIHGLSTLRPLAPITVLFLLHGRLQDLSLFNESISSLNLPALNSRDNLQRQLYLPQGERY